MKLGIIRLYVGESGELGYYNIQEIGLAKALSKKKIKTDIFFLVNKKQHKNIIIKDLNKYIRIIYLPAFKLINHGIISPKFILEYKLDIVHLLSDNQIMAPNFIKFCEKNNIFIYNYIGTVNSDTQNIIKKIIMKFITKRNFEVYRKSINICKNKDVEKMLKLKGIKNSKVIPVGLDFDIIPKIKEEKISLRKKLKLPIDKKILIFVGRLELYKDPIKSIYLIKELLKKDKDYFLVIIGDGSLKVTLRNMIQEYNITDYVKVISKIENNKIHYYYKASDIYLNFNKNEIFGMAILEAMNQGCKVLAQEAPGPNFIIDNNLNGILIDNNKLEVWIKKINEVIDNEFISKYAIKKVKEEFSWDKISDKYISLYQDIYR